MKRYMKSVLQVQLPTIRGKGLVEHTTQSMNLCLSPRATNKLYIYLVHYDIHGNLGAEGKSNRRMSMENCILVQEWIPFKSGIGSLSTDSTAIREICWFLVLETTEEYTSISQRRTETVNVMELLRGLILGVHLYRSLGILRIIWKKFDYGCEKSVRLLFESSTTTLFLFSVCCSLGK